MPKIMKTVAVAAPVLTEVFAVLYQFFPFGAYLSLAITFGTIAYHFVMRLIVGLIYNVTMRNHANYNAAYFRQRSWEKKLYQALHVKQWKGKMPTYSPENFDPTRHSWDEIAQAMCQAELVHETIILLSFLPLLAAIPFGDFRVFFFTSLGGALFDGFFVIMQRFNRRIFRHHAALQPPACREDGRERKKKKKSISNGVGSVSRPRILIYPCGRNVCLF